MEHLTFFRSEISRESRRLGVAACLLLTATLAHPQSRPDLSVLNGEEQLSIEAACSRTKLLSGPAAYDRCLQGKLEDWSRGPKAPDLSVFNAEERHSIQSACSTEKLFSGPAAYDRCLQDRLKILVSLRRDTDLRSGDVVRDPFIPSPDSLSSASTVEEKTLPRHTSPKQPQPENSPEGLQPLARASSDGWRTVPTALPSGSSESGREGVPWLLRGACIAFLLSLGKILRRKRKCVRCQAVRDSTGALCTSCLHKQNEADRAAREQAETARKRKEAEEPSRREADIQHRQREERERRARLRTIEGLDKLTGSEFEELIESLFRDDGYEVQRCGRSRDDGIDLIIKVSTSTDVVQCMRWRSDIRSPVVHEFYGAMMHADARHGFIVTTADFSVNARAFARGKPISLISGQDLVRWIDRRYSARAEADDARSSEWEYGFISSSDPFSILDVPRSASSVEIRNAYHREISKYHPDKVAHLGDELQQLAKRRAQTINQAYADICKR